MRARGLDDVFQWLAKPPKCRTEPLEHLLLTLAEVTVAIEPVRDGVKRTTMSETLLSGLSLLIFRAVLSQREASHVAEKEDA